MTSKKNFIFFFHFDIYYSPPRSFRTIHPLFLYVEINGGHAKYNDLLQIILGAVGYETKNIIGFEGDLILVERVNKFTPEFYTRLQVHRSDKFELSHDDIFNMAEKLLVKPDLDLSNIWPYSNLPTGLDFIFNKRSNAACSYNQTLQEDVPELTPSERL